MDSIPHNNANVTPVTRYITPDQVCELFPGITRGQLAQWRYRGEGGPRYRKLGKKVLYVIDECIEWAESTARSGTAAEAV